MMVFFQQLLCSFCHTSTHCRELAQLHLSAELDAMTCRATLWM